MSEFDTGRVHHIGDLVDGTILPRRIAHEQRWREGEGVVVMAAARSSIEGAMQVAAEARKGHPLAGPVPADLLPQQPGSGTGIDAMSA